MHLTKSSIARVCGLALGILLAGCGSSGSSGGDATAPFVGSWTYSSGSIQPMCNLQGIPPFDLTGDTMTITKGTGSNTVATSLTGNGVMCNVNFTVSGDMATAMSNQTCTVAVNAGALGTVSVLIHISTWTLTVSGNMLSMAMTGTASDSTGVLSCNPTANGAATRAASDGGAGG
ncbi:MAG TPA: hypothetical protein VN853_12970 [Polyangia bacterium]|nr:hypothetical protein [Polyangia bacterium]